MDVTVAFDINDPDQNAKGRWIESCLLSAGFSPRDWHTVGSNWVADLDEAAAAEDEPCVIVITPGAASTSPATLMWQAVLASSERRAVIPVYFDAAEPLGLLSARVSIRVDNDDVDTARAQLVQAVTHAVRGTRSAHLEGRRDVAIGIDTTRELPRLRRLTDRTMRDASAVGARYFEWDANPAGQSLYVRRDVQDDVMRRMRQQSLTVISGDPGVGKTSLLWGVASELLDDPNSEVVFIRAAMLTTRASDGAPMTSDRLQSALRECHRIGKQAFVLIDTADVLVGGDDIEFLSLMDVIDVAETENASTIVTSRPAQADSIAAGRTPTVRLNAYAVTGENGQPSEFSRAVASHATAYCRRPGDTSALAGQINLAVVRGQSLGSIASHPLTLRMLFELYAPGLVPENVDATELFEKYWTDRVFSDRRSWVSTAIAVEADLTSTAMRIAHHMLKSGVPEARVADITADSPASRAALNADVEVLCTRGIGQVGEFGVFAFFHQTFFEFAAAKSLFLRSVSPLRVLAARVQARPGDYVLLAVLEQTWICAYRLEGQHRAAANELTVAVLSTSPGDHGQLHASRALRRCAMRVGAQSILDARTREAIGIALDNEAEGGVVRDFLGLLPRPGRPWADPDTMLLARCCLRRDASWHSVIDVLHRIAAASPDTALRVFDEITSDHPQPLLSEEGLMRRQTREFLSQFVFSRTDAVLAFLTRAICADPGVRKVGVLERVFDIVDRESNAPAAIVTWARSISPSQTPTSAFVRKLANLHRRAAEADLADPIAGDRSERLLASFSRDLESIAAATTYPTSNPAAACWGFLQALGARSRSPSAQLAALVADALSVLSGFESPRVHEQIHHGWLTELINHAPAAKTWARYQLFNGLPAAHSGPVSPAQRWADSVRRTLERYDTSRAALIEIVSSGSEWAIDRLWSQPDMLLRLLLASACAGVPGAVAVLLRLIQGSATLTEAEWGILVQQAQRLQPADAENRSIVELLVMRKEYVGLEQLSRREPSPRWSDHSATAATMSALADTWSHKQTLRRQATSFLKQATKIGVIPYPVWDDVAAAITHNTDDVVRADLVEVARNAVDACAFDASPLVAYLRPRLADDLTRGELANTHEARNLRRIQVSLLALHGDPLFYREAIELAFLPCVEKEAVKNLAGYFIPERRSAGPVPIDVAVRILIEVGKRLTSPSAPDRSPRDVAGTWKRIYPQILNRADNHSLLTVISALPDMAEPYAASVVDRLPRRTGSPLAAALASVEPRSPEPVRRSIEFYLRRGDNPAGGWPEIEMDLAQPDPSPQCSLFRPGRF